jgi:pantetheine-phosphate adenylyltransferase
MSKSALYPGSFDPVTLGHIDIISRVSKLFDEVTVVVAQAQNKTSLFSLSERRDLLSECLKGIKNVKVDICEGLTADYARKKNIKVLIRGLRGIGDFEQEWVIAHMNKRLNPEIETFFIFSDLQHSLISSRVVKEVAFSGGPLESLVPPQVIPQLLKKIGRSK